MTLSTKRIFTFVTMSEFKVGKGYNYTYTDIDDAVQGHVCRYYEFIQEDNAIRLDLDKHLRLVEFIEAMYFKWLNKKVKSEFENAKQLFRNSINFLTSIDAKISKRQEQIINKQSIINSIKNKSYGNF